MNTSFEPKARGQGRPWVGFSVRLFAVLTIFIVLGEPVYGAEAANKVFAAVVKVHSDVPADARTARSLGTEREGSGVVIDSGGLVLTIGYLILEAMRAEVVGPSGKPINAKIIGYDHNTGFGLLRATKPLGVTPMKFGKSSVVSERDEVIVASHGGTNSVQGAFVVSRREFAGYWEYLLENAIFTVPPHPDYGGAALIGPDGRLLGIGSLYVEDALPGHGRVPSNMFVPIDRLKPILADLITQGRSAEPPRPWLGVYSQEVGGRILVQRVSPGSPAYQAGIQPNDIIVGVAGKEVEGLADFYRKVWSRGNAGVEVPLNVLQGTRVRELTVRSADRYKYLRLNPSF
ncbi:MAG: S1C family serine protease [Candidatus Binatia bacterium]